MIRTILACVAMLPMLAGTALADSKPPRAAAPAPRGDLADMVVGTYHGDVISDSRGSSQSDVTLTVVKVGPNKVSVSSSYRRLGTFTVGLTRAMQTIQQANGYATVFLVDLSRSPYHLDVNVDGASWSGDKQ